MRQIILTGLGNPGPSYAGTRHNVGYMLVEGFSSRFKKSWRCPFLYCDEDRFFAVKPLTYMNRSGRAVECALKIRKAKPEDLLVVCDDFNLPLGKLRLRPSGSAGGHNGLQSIIDSLSTDAFPRLRIGIGGEEVRDKTAFVLEKFSPSEMKNLQDALITARQLVGFYIANGMEAAMNEFN